MINDYPIRIHFDEKNEDKLFFSKIHVKDGGSLLFGHYQHSFDEKS